MKAFFAKHLHKLSLMENYNKLCIEQFKSNSTKNTYINTLSIMCFRKKVNIHLNTNKNLNESQQKNEIKLNKNQINIKTAEQTTNEQEQKIGMSSKKEVKKESKPSIFQKLKKVILQNTILSDNVVDDNKKPNKKQPEKAKSDKKKNESKSKQEKKDAKETPSKPSKETKEEKVEEKSNSSPNKEATSTTESAQQINDKPFPKSIAELFPTERKLNDKEKDFLNQAENINILTSNYKDFILNPLREKNMKKLNNNSFKHTKEEILKLNNNGKKIGAPSENIIFDIYRGDIVVVLKGEFKGQSGKVKFVDRDKEKIIVDGINNERVVPDENEANDYIMNHFKKHNKNLNDANVKQKHIMKPKFIYNPVELKHVGLLSPFCNKIITPIIEFDNELNKKVRKCPETGKVLPFPKGKKMSILSVEKRQQFANDTGRQAVMLKTFKGIDYGEVAEIFISRMKLQAEKESKLILKDKFIKNEDLL